MEVVPKTGQRPALAGVAALLAVGGCGTSMAGSAAPAPDATTTTATKPPPSEPPTTKSPKKLLAPHVQQPLDASNYLKPNQGCKILDKDQLHQLGMSNPTGNVDYKPGLAAGCDYNSHEYSVGVSFKLSDNDGLSTTYADREHMDYWKPLSIQGRPAVLADRDDARDMGICLINVGINDQRSFFIQFSANITGQEAQACGKAKQAANLVVTSLIKYPNP